MNLKCFFILFLISFNSWSVEDCSKTSWEKTFFKNSPIEKLPTISFKKEITIAVIDSGFDYSSSLIIDSIPDKYLPNPKQYLDFTANETQPFTSHGMSVFGVLNAIIPQAKIIPINIRGFNVEQNKAGHDKVVSSLMKALNFVIKEKIDIVNLSMGHEDRSQEEEELIKYAKRKGIIIITSAGNNAQNIDQESTSSFPASYNLENVIVVGSSSVNEKSFFSNYGPQTVDFHTQGEKIALFKKDNTGKCDFEIDSGTSFSTAIVTALIARIKASEPEITMQDIKTRLIKMSTAEKKATSKYGIINLNNG